MKLARRALDDPNRRVELEAAFDDRISELIGEANDAGYSTQEAFGALVRVVNSQMAIAGKNPDPTDDPS